MASSRTFSAPLEALDAAAESGMSRLRGLPGADHLLYTASAVGDHSLIWLVLGAVRATRSGRDRLAAARLGVGLAVESALVNGVIKSVVGRRRPSGATWHPRPFRQPRTSSFPSGHASSAACALVLLADEDPAWPLYIVIAFAVTASRAYVRIHHASDLLAGLAFGTALGLAVRRLAPLDRLDRPGQPRADGPGGPHSEESTAPPPR
ncbi:MAG TPA: phosphatase PAP2 family protein [Acidimicrobiales bacterium]|nr:phosphatase PAP2 family protein [Acidimicrobiales bacterium]